MNIMEIEYLADSDVLEPRVAAWNSLLPHSRNDSIFLSQEWFTCWLAAFQKDSSSLLLIAKKDDCPVAAAPLLFGICKLRGLLGWVITFIENDEVPYSDFLVRPGQDSGEAISSFLAYINGTGKDKWDVLLLRRIPDFSPSIPVLKDFCTANGYMFLCRPAPASPVLEIRGEWEAFYKATSQRFKKRTRYNRNNLKKLGEFSIEELVDPDQIEQAMAEVLQVDAASWKGQRGIGMSSQPETSRFFSMLPRALAQWNGVSLWCLRVGGKMMAFEYHIRDRETVYALRAGFDEEAKAYAPGAVLDFHIVQELFKQGRTQLYNMCGSRDAYKVHWTDQTQPYFNIMVFNQTPRGYLLALLEKGIIPTLKKAWLLFRRS